MPLRPLSDTSAADWFVDADADWWTRVCLGPPGFEAYVRVYYDLEPESPTYISAEVTRRDLRFVLAGHTTTDECFFGIWNGNPDGECWHAGERVSIHLAPGGVGHYAAARTYHLFTGQLLDAHEADDGNGLALSWPADHAWFAAGDVDPGWIGVGGTQALIDELLADARLDVAPTTYDATDWEDR